MTATIDRPPVAGRAASTWGLSWSGVRTVAVLELRQRVRSTRWIVVLVLVFLALLGLTLRVRSAVHASLDPADNGPGTSPQQLGEYAAATVFGIVVFLVLALGGSSRPR